MPLAMCRTAICNRNVFINRVTTHLENMKNLEKSGNSKVVREKSGKMEKVGGKSGETEISFIIQHNFYVDIYFSFILVSFSADCTKHI